MKKTTTTAIFLLSVMLLSAQQLKKTYYDYHKTKVDEEYQMNSAGYINGTYKKYNEAGALIQTGSAKDGKKEGVWSEYSTYSGKRELAKSETYKNNELNGLATYYGENGIVLRQGNYKNEKKDGKWLILQPYSNYDLKPEEIGNCKYTKTEVIFKDDNEVEGIETDGSYKFYYVPCNKIYCEYTVKDSKIDGEMKWYYPNGKVSEIKKYDYSTGAKKKLYSKSYFPNGQLHVLEDFSSGQRKYEGFELDGSPDQTMLRFQKEEQSKIASLAADSALLKGDYEKARGLLKSIIGSYDLQSLIDKLAAGDEAASKKDYREAMGQYESAKYYAKDENKTALLEKKIKAIEPQAEKQKELKTISWTLEGKWKTYNSLYKLSESGTYYPLGELLYQKSLLILQDYFGEYDKESDVEKKYDYGQRLISFYNKLEEIAKSDTKELTKQLKKAKEKDEIKKAFGLN